MTWRTWIAVMRARLGTSPWRQWFLLCSAFSAAACIHVLLFGALQKHYATRLEEKQIQMIAAVTRLNDELLRWSDAINELNVATRGLQDKQRDLDGEAARLQARQVELDTKMKDVRTVLQKFVGAMRATHPLVGPRPKE